MQNNVFYVYRHTSLMMTKLREMMSETDDPKQRETLKKCMRELERD